jgi:hypothetical protein
MYARIIVRVFAAPIALRLKRNRQSVSPVSSASSLHLFGVRWSKTFRQQYRERYDLWTVLTIENDHEIAVLRFELVQHLPATTARCYARRFRGCDRYRQDLTVTSRDGGIHRHSLSTDRHWIARVFDIRAGEDRPVRRQRRGADLKIRIGRIGTVGSFSSYRQQLVRHFEIDHAIIPFAR